MMKFVEGGEAEGIFVRLVQPVEWALAVLLCINRGFRKEIVKPISTLKTYYYLYFCCYCCCCC